MKEILLTKGFVTVVDDEDYEEMSRYKWHIARGYASTNIRHPKFPGKWLKIGMHRMLMGLEYGDVRDVDHRNELRLDNRRENLRVCAQSENSFNRGPMVNNKCGLKGVYWETAKKRWRAQIGINGKTKYIGSFPTPEEAHLAYCAAAKEIHGEYFNPGRNSPLAQPPC